MKMLEDNYTIVEGLSVYQEEDNSHLLETHGDDLRTVLKIGKKNPKKVWTLIDVGLNHLVAVAGYHLCNRIHYVITVEEWKDEDESYIY